MASKSFKVCDWCKKETAPRECYSNEDKDWRRIKVEFGQYNKRNFDLCPDCLAKLGITENNGKPKSISEPTTYEKLFEIISDIVNDAIDNK